MPINSTPVEIWCQDFGSWFLLPLLSGPVLPSSKDPSWAESCLSTSSPSKGPSLFPQPRRDDCRQQHPLKSDHVLPLLQKRENQQLFSSTGNLVKSNRTALSVPRPVCKGQSLLLMDRRWEPGPIHCSHIMLAMPGLGLKILMSSHSRWICLLRVLFLTKNRVASHSSGACMKYAHHELRDHQMARMGPRLPVTSPTSESWRTEGHSCKEGLDLQVH